MTGPLSPARLRVVIDHEDHVQTHQRLAQLGDVRAGRVVCHIKPGPQRLPNLGAAVLGGLGKNLDGRGNNHSSAANWRRCGLWLSAERISELIVVRAQYLDRRGWRSLIALASQANCGLTLTVSGCELNAWQSEMLAEWPFERLTIGEWQDKYELRWPPAEAADTTRGAGFPPVPSDDFTLFRATCRRRLAPTDFELVDRRWRAARAAAQAWTDSALVLDEAAVAAFLRGAVRTAESYGEVVTVLRACQAVFFLAGWLVKVNDERVMASALQEPYDLLTAASADLLRTFVTPRHSAAATLAMVLRESPEALASLRCLDIAADGTAVRWKEQDWDVPAEFACFLRAQRYERAADGDTDDAAFFVATDGFCPRREDGRTVALSGRSLQFTLRTVVRETGLLVTTEFSAAQANADASKWMHRRGVSVTAITLARQRTLRAAP